MIQNNLISFIKYLISAGTSFALDILLFHFLELLLGIYLGNTAIILASILARICSSLYNYLVNSRFVFAKYDKHSIYKYYLLVLIQMFISTFATYILKIIFEACNATIIKIFVDIIIFIVNYFIQKKFIFN